MPPSWAAAALGLGALYYMMGQAALTLATVNASASPFWPPTGIAIAGLVILGARFAPVLWLGAFAFNLATAGTIVTSAAIATGNLLEGLAGAWVVRRWAGGAAAFQKPGDAVRFAILGAAGAPIVSATIGVTTLAFAGLAPWTSFFRIWFTWWLGDAAGALVVAPLLILWVQGGLPRWSHRERLETSALLLTTILLGFIVFSSQVPSAYVTLPLLVWAAMRFGPRETSTVSVILNAAAVIGTTRGLGPFADASQNAGLLQLAGYIVTTTLIGLVLASVAAERRRDEAIVRRGRDELELEVARRTASLQATQQRFAAFMKDLPGLAWIKSTAGRYEYANDNFAASVGRAPKDVIGRTDEELFPAASAQEYRANDLQALATGSVVATTEHQVVAGRTRRNLVRKFPILDSDGSPEAVAGVAIDITDQVEAEQNLRRSQEALATAQSMAHIGSWSWDVAADKVEWSDELHQIFGISKGEHVDYARYLGGVHPDDRALVDDHIQGALRTGQPATFRHRVRRPDGTLRWVQSEGKVETGSDGRPVRVFGTAQDVTDVRASEQRFQRLMEAAPDAFVIADAGGHIVMVNAATEKLFGYSPGELQGQSIEILVPLPLRDGHVGHRERYMKEPRARPMGVNRDLHAVRKDGTEIPVEISLSPLETPEGPLVISAIRDVSERRRADKERAELDRLRSMNEFKTKFINMAAHELNTPLTPVKLQAHMLRTRLGPTLHPDHRHSLEVLERNIDRMAVLVQNMLDVARIQSGRIELKKRPLEVHGAVEEVVESFRALAARGGVDLRHRKGGDVWVHGDAPRLNQVLFNLVSNAIKFTPPGGSVLMEVTTRDADVVVRVRDTGAGLTPDQIGILFQPFTQVHTGTQTAQRPGTGLGLYISRQLVELHGGRLWAESDGPGLGSTFQFTLPGATAKATGLAPGHHGPTLEAGARTD